MTVSFEWIVWFLWHLAAYLFCWCCFFLVGVGAAFGDTFAIVVLLILLPFFKKIQEVYSSSVLAAFCQEI